MSIVFPLIISLVVYAVHVESFAQGGMRERFRDYRPEDVPDDSPWLGQDEELGKHERFRPHEGFRPLRPFGIPDNSQSPGSNEGSGNHHGSKPNQSFRPRPPDSNEGSDNHHGFKPNQSFRPYPPDSNEGSDNHHGFKPNQSFRPRPPKRNEGSGNHHGFKPNQGFRPRPPDSNEGSDNHHGFKPNQGFRPHLHDSNFDSPGFLGKNLGSGGNSFGSQDAQFVNNFQFPDPGNDITPSNSGNGFSFTNSHPINNLKPNFNKPNGIELRPSHSQDVNVYQISRLDQINTTRRPPFTTSTVASTTETTTRIPPRDPAYRIVYTVSCPCPYTRQYDPVCGTDGQTYGNLGVIHCAQHCGSGVRIYLMGACGRNRG